MSKLIQTVMYYLNTSKKERRRQELNAEIDRQKAIKAFEDDPFGPSQYMA